MSDQEGTASAREVWLRVALAVARDGMPQPQQFEVRDDVEHNRVNMIFYERVELAEEWAGWLGLGSVRREVTTTDGARNTYWWAGFHNGYHWTVTAYVSTSAVTATPSDLAAEVTEAIERTEIAGRVLGLR